MQIVTNGRNIELTDAIKSYVQEKLSRLENHYDFIQEIHVILEVMKNPRINENQLAEATVHVPGATFRVETASETLYASIDKLSDLIERQMRKHKTKLMNRSGKHGHESIRHETLPVTETEEEVEDIDAELEADFKAEFKSEEDLEAAIAETEGEEVSATPKD